MHDSSAVAAGETAASASTVGSASRVLAGLRIYLGLVFLIAVLPKIKAGSGFTAMMSGFLQHVGLSDAHPFYKPFIADVILPRAGLFAALVVAGELFVGLALVAGVVTRLAALVAMMLVVNYMSAKGAWFWHPSSNDAAFFVIALALLIGRAGRIWGVDRRLAERWPAVPLW